MKINKKLIACVFMASLTIGSSLVNAIRYSELTDPNRTSGVDLVEAVRILAHNQSDTDRSRRARGEVSLRDARTLLDILGEDGGSVTDKDIGQEHSIREIARLLRHHIIDVEHIIGPFERTEELRLLMTEHNAFEIAMSLRDLMEKYNRGRGPGFKDWVVQKAWTERTWADYGALAGAGMIFYATSASELTLKFASIVEWPFVKDAGKPFMDLAAAKEFVLGYMLQPAGDNTEGIVSNGLSLVDWF